MPQAELYYEASNKNELTKIKIHRGLLHTFPVDVAISNQFINLMETYTLSHKLNIPDSIIASIAVVQKIKLYTLNLSDFCFIQGLELYDLSNE